MKAKSYIVLLAFFCALEAPAQSRYAVEFIGGIKCGGLGPEGSGLWDGFTAGIGASKYFGSTVELTGIVLFTHYSQSNLVNVYHLSTYYGEAPKQDGQYSGEIVAGLRFHGQGSRYIHPYLVLQGGILLLRSSLYQGGMFASTLSTNQFLNIHGTDDIQMLEIVNVGFGVQIRPTQSVHLNFEAKYQILLGPESSVESLIPVVVSVQLPM